MKTIKVSPSILGVKDTVKVINELMTSGADMIHYDVMDGRFVENKSFSIDDFRLTKNNVDKNIIFDVHLMVCDVEKEIESYINEGADIITFHYEAVKFEEIKKYIDLIHLHHKKAGISINPNTSVTVLNEFLNEVDLVLIMSVYPGKGGQKFIDDVLGKVKYLDDYRNEHNCSFVIEIDGGINNQTSLLAKENGVDILVAGSYIIKAESFKEAIESLK